MEVITLKRLTKNGANEVLFLNQQKTYSFGRMSQNDFELCFPTVSKKHCIFHHNSNGLFVEVLKSLEGVVVNGKKYSTGSMVRLYNKDLVVIGLVHKYQVEIKPIVQDFDTKTNFTSDFEIDYERIKTEDLCHVNIKKELELEDATIDKDTHYEENWGARRGAESFNSAVSTEIKEEVTLHKKIQEISLQKETQAINLDEIHSPIQITIDEENLKSLFPLNSTEETLTDPKKIVNISREPETLKLDEFSNFVRKETRLRRSRRMNKGILQKSCDESFKNRLSEKPTFSNKWNKTSLKENETSLIENEISNGEVSENQSEISKERSRIFKERNIVSNQESEISPKRISNGFPRKQNKIVLERLSVGDSKNATHSVRKIGNDFVGNLGTEYSERNLRSEASLPKSKLETESVKQLETNFVLEIDSVKNLPTESSSSKTKLETKETEQLPKRKIPESSKLKIREEIKECSSLTIEMKSCQEEENPLPGKQLSVTLTDILKNPVSNFTSMKKLPSKSEKLKKKPKSNSDGPFRCEKCGKDFVLNSRLKRHLETHTEERPFTCAICEMTFKSKINVALHLRIHFGLNRRTCGICNKILAHQASLERHIMTHSSTRKFKCKECRKLFLLESDLQEHMKRHTNVKKHKCPDCDKSYIFKRWLTNHIWMNHTRHECNVCNQVFQWESKLKEHQRIHTGEKPFVCQVCQMGFRGRKLLSDHMRYWHKARFSCNECKETFPNKFKLKKHLTIHFPEDGNICQDCGYVARGPSSMIVHRRKHTGERPFQCLVCDKTFAFKNILRVHMLVHVGECPHQCKKCDEGFGKSSLLKIHSIKHRNK